MVQRLLSLLLTDAYHHAVTWCWWAYQWLQPARPRLEDHATSTTSTATTTSSAGPSSESHLSFPASAFDPSKVNPPGHATNQYPWEMRHDFYDIVRRGTRHGVYLLRHQAGSNAAYVLCCGDGILVHIEWDERGRCTQCTDPRGIVGCVRVTS